MRKLLFGAVALGLLATASCKKDDDKDATGPSNTISASNQTFAVSGVNVLRRIVTINGSNGGDRLIFQLTFGTGSAEPSEGTYNIVEEADALNEVQINVVRIVNATTTNYSSQDNSPIVSIRKNDGKMSVSFPNTTVKPGVGGGSENIVISANATQP
jgi:hypothetical protein